MQKKRKQIEWIRYEQDEVLPKPYGQLLQAAEEGWKKAWAPYSRFLVGAAVLLENGQIISAGNQENAAYPMCLCAERAALAAAASACPNVVVQALAIKVKNLKKKLTQPATPCGACRQVLYETEQRQSGQKITLVLQAEEGPIVVLHGADTLLPFGFDSSSL